MDDAVFYVMDDATRVHLNAWCDCYLHDDERDAIRDAMLQHLAKSTVEEADYILDSGWPRLANLVGSPRD